MKLSIVATLYHSEVHVLEFYRRVSAVAKKLVGSSYEIILVNDGSPDRSLDISIALAKTDEKLKIIDLSKNFGHHKAMMTGLSFSIGEQVFLIDSDMEEDPEWLIDFSNEVTKTKADVVFGVQEKRKGNTFEKISGMFFYKIMNKLAEQDFPKNVITARLMSRKFVEALLLHKESEVYFHGLCHITGFKQHKLAVKKLSHSQTTYDFRKKIVLFITSISSFSNAPLIAAFYFGSCISIASLFYIIYLVCHWFFMSQPVDGWTSVIASIWLLGGLIIFFIGVIGIYLSKIFIEVKQRPYTIVKNIYSLKKDN